MSLDQLNVSPNRRLLRIFAYEHIFHSPGPSSPLAANCFVDLDLDFSGMGEGAADAVGQAAHNLHCLGIWFDSSEKRWTKNRYERSDSTWWLIIPVKIESKTAVTEPAINGTNLRIEIYPANDELLEKRFHQVQGNLEMLPIKHAVLFNSI